VALYGNAHVCDAHDIDYGDEAAVCGVCRRTWWRGDQVDEARWRAYWLPSADWPAESSMRDPERVLMGRRVFVAERAEQVRRGAARVPRVPRSA
jgi:hypothetical protein